MSTLGVGRRSFLKTFADAAALGLRRAARAQGRTIKIGVVSPVTGAMAEVTRE